MEENKVKNIGQNLLQGLMDALNLVKVALTEREQAWEKFKNIEVDPKSFFLKYLLPLGIVVTIVKIIKFSIIGVSVFSVTIREPFFHAIFNHLTAFLVSVLILLVASFIISKLSENGFGSPASFNSVFGWLGYTALISYTATIALIIPYLGMLVSLLALVFCIWFLWVGMKAYLNQTEKATTFFIVSIVTVIVIGFIFGLIQSSAFGWQQPSNDVPSYNIKINDQNLEDIQKNLQKSVEGLIERQ